jgi:metacaspase-1
MKKAVVVGNNAFATPNTLHGCINDANDVDTTFQSKGFFVNKLFNSPKAGTINALNQMVDACQLGNQDKIAFYYSSHGSQVRDTNGDESDGWDEVLCPIDWPKYISDDDLRAIFNRIPADTTLDVFLDCCHSGTGTREMLLANGSPDPLGPAGEVRCLGTSKCLPAIKGRNVAKEGKRSKAIVLVPTLNHILHAACRDNQLSTEIQVTINGVPTSRGAFTYYEMRAIRAGYTRDAAITYTEGRLAALGLDQTPQLEATQSESTQLPFT